MSHSLLNTSTSHLHLRTLLGGGGLAHD